MLRDIYDFFKNILTLQEANRGNVLVPPDIRIHELNRRLTNRPAEADNLW